MQKIANIFVNKRELSAQEAAWYILGLPMKQASEQVIFIPIYPPEERQRVAKPVKILKEMPQDSTDILWEDIADKYATTKPFEV